MQQTPLPALEGIRAARMGHRWATHVTYSRKQNWCHNCWIVTTPIHQHHMSCSMPWLSYCYFVFLVRYCTLSRKWRICDGIPSVPFISAQPTTSFSSNHTTPSSKNHFIVWKNGRLIQNSRYTGTCGRVIGDGKQCRYKRRHSSEPDRGISWPCLTPATRNSALSIEWTWGGSR